MEQNQLIIPKKTLSSKDITINNEEFRVFENEYNKIDHKEYCNLRILDSLGFHERLVSLLSEISSIYPEKISLRMNDVTHGGYLPIKCSPYFHSIYIRLHTYHNKHSKNIIYNINKYLPKSNIFLSNDILQSSEDWFDINWDKPNENIIISLNPFLNLSQYTRYELTNLSTEWTPQPTLYIYVSQCMNDLFKKHFNYYLKDLVLDYDNLIHLCIMVKNGGTQFENMLKDNLPIIDRWTILDTGSTDQTVETIHNTLVGTKNGELYEEPFVNFKVSRNRCLDLAGKKCKFIIMLDDTYVINGDLRKFLNIVRGDQFSTSFTLYIQSDDTEYGSNRIIKSESGLRYIHRIHEVISDKENRNVVIPSHVAKIIDRRFAYMEERTMKRKELDLKLLYEEIEEDPSDPRAYYYLGQTYNLMGEHEKAFYYFMKRCEFTNSGFIQERVDAAFEAARIANFQLHKPWKECLALYERAFKIDESRPETQYFIGIHYFLENNFHKAYPYFKKAFEIGYPSHCQYSLKPTLSFHFLPKFLTRTCYHVSDFLLGEQAALFFLHHNKQDADDFNEITSWYKIYQYLNKYNPTNNILPKKSEKPLFVFVADGGFNQWSGSNILTTGVGGSETYIIEMARYIQQSGQFDVIVFCNCSQNEIFENVQYKHLNEYFAFIQHNHIHTCIISRFSEYVPVTYKGFVDNVYMVLHDLTPSGNVIPIDNKLKGIFCLTEWHVEYMKQHFPSLSSYLIPFYYGIDTNRFVNTNKIKKESYRFIYSSFPNRGLLPLLQMWHHIHQKYPQATLHIYSDINGKWVNEVVPEQMREIRKLLAVHKNKNIVYHGWVDKQTLADGWHSADIWFYPCTFMETFCLTALEAATTKTLAVTNDLAALQNTVGDRGVVINGDPMTSEWQSEALEKLFYYMDEKNKMTKDKIIERNYEWAKELTWKNQANWLLQQYIPSPIFSSLSPPYKNLIFLTVFDSTSVKSLYLLLQSIHLYGNINHNTTHLLIYTTTEIEQQIKNDFTLLSTFTVHFALNHTIHTPQQSNQAKYHLFHLPHINHYQNILYLHHFTLINKDIDHIFQLCQEDKLYGLHTYNLDNEIEYCGKTIFTQDELHPLYDKKGISSNILLFKNSDTIKQLFTIIQDDMISRKQFLSSNYSDLPYLNYHTTINYLVNKKDLLSKCTYTNNSNDLFLNKSIVSFESIKTDYYHIILDFFNKRKMDHIDWIRYQAYQYIQQYMMPLVLSFEPLLEGSLFNNHLTNTTSSTYRDKQINICNILLTNKIENVLEIGFNAGFSSLMMLLTHPTIKITCVDLGEHPYTRPCFEWLSKQFPNRIEFFEGSSLDILPTFIEKQKSYDFIHIDGGHANNCVFHDIHNSLKLSHKNTLLLMDDTDQQHIALLWSLFHSYYKLIECPLLVKTDLHHLAMTP